MVFLRRPLIVMLVKLGFMIIFVVVGTANAGVDDKNADEVHRLKDRDVLQKLTRW